MDNSIEQYYPANSMGGYWMAPYAMPMSQAYFYHIQHMKNVKFMEAKMAGS